MSSCVGNFGDTQFHCTILEALYSHSLGHDHHGWQPAKGPSSTWGQSFSVAGLCLFCPVLGDSVIFETVKEDLSGQVGTAFPDCS